MNGTTELAFAALFGAALMMALVGWIVGDVPVAMGLDR